MYLINIYMFELSKFQFFQLIFTNYFKFEHSCLLYFDHKHFFSCMNDYLDLNKDNN